MTDTIHTFTDDALGNHDAVGLAAELRAGRLDRREVLDAAVERVRRADAHLHAVQAECFDRARRTPVADGPFAGVPAFVKDNTDAAGLPTCHGSAAFRPQPARRSSGPARQFLGQGFALLGKSTLPEFGLTASTEYVDRPATRNPWNLAHSAGASSGGSAALVASGAVPIAHANDGGGSIRIPAAVNGLVGLKPTRARLLDQPGARQLPVNLVTEGVLTRTVRDTAHYLAAAERFRPAPHLPPIGLVEGPSERRLRIGVIRHDILGRGVHPETEAVLDSALRTLAAAGHEITETRLAVDPDFVEDFKTYWALFAVLLSASSTLLHPTTFRPWKLDPFTRGLAGKVLRDPAAVPAAIRRLRGGTALYDAHFAEFDALLTPVLSHPAPRIGEHSPAQPFEELFAKLIDYVGFTPFNNVGGGPAIAVPHGLTGANLPGSVQLCAPRGHERDLLDLAYQLEAASPFPKIATGVETTA
ncbi:amidase [Nocardia blacklockiae]|uniref:amidase n=1 Tax=Nocardia blacklockiae TaxID=480036 RepID=UPI001894BF8F|nr:amidase [Nocardia blacklockiae]MBF6170654.1 amidase [Nocardia blacklockiae]